jgi:pimeloyl-ACP methyl ester carboxylesterase
MQTISENRSVIKTIQGPAGSLRISDGGRDVDLPVVFVHSFGGNINNWKYQLEHFRKHRRAIAFDFRGHGESEAPINADYSVPSLARDIEAVINHLQIEYFVLVGHSIGGSAAIHYAANNPEWVTGLVITGTPGKSPESLSKPIIASLESSAFGTVMDQYLEKLLTNAKPETKELIYEEFRKMPDRDALNVIKSAFAYDPLPDLHRFPHPVLIIDPDGENPNSLHAQLPDLPHQTIPGTSHWAQFDKWREFNLILEEFIKSLDTGNFR